MCPKVATRWKVISRRPLQREGCWARCDTRQYKTPWTERRRTTQMGQFADGGVSCLSSTSMRRVRRYSSSMRYWLDWSMRYYSKRVQIRDRQARTKSRDAGVRSRVGTCATGTGRPPSGGWRIGDVALSLVVASSSDGCGCGARSGLRMRFSSWKEWRAAFDLMAAEDGAFCALLVGHSLGVGSERSDSAAVILSPWSRSHGASY
jgi:hypothetical protein